MRRKIKMSLLECEEELFDNFSRIELGLLLSMNVRNSHITKRKLAKAVALNWSVGPKQKIRIVEVK